MARLSGERLRAKGAIAVAGVSGEDNDQPFFDLSDPLSSPQNLREGLSPAWRDTAGAVCGKPACVTTLGPKCSQTV